MSTTACHRVTLHFGADVRLTVSLTAPADARCIDVFGGRETLITERGQSIDVAGGPITSGGMVEAWLAEAARATREEAVARWVATQGSRGWPVVDHGEIDLSRTVEHSWIVSESLLAQRAVASRLPAWPMWVRPVRYGSSVGVPITCLRVQGDHPAQLRGRVS